MSTEERELWAVIDTRTGKIYEPSGAPFDGVSEDEVKLEVMQTLCCTPESVNEWLRQNHLDVVRLTSTTEKQYRDLCPTD